MLTVASRHRPARVQCTLLMGTSRPPGRVYGLAAARTGMRQRHVASMPLLAVLGVHLAVASLAWLAPGAAAAAAAAPSIEANELGVVLSVPKGRDVFVRFTDPTTGEADPDTPPQRLVTEVSCGTAKPPACAEVDRVGQRRRHPAHRPLATVTICLPQRLLTHAEPPAVLARCGLQVALEALIEPIVTRMLASAVVSGNFVTSPLVDEAKLDAAVASLATSSDLDAVATEADAKIAAIQARQAKSQACNDVDLVYNAAEDHCDDPTTVDCGTVVRNLPAHLVQPGRCTGDTSCVRHVHAH